MSQVPGLSEYRESRDQLEKYRAAEIKEEVEEGDKRNWK